MAARGQVQGLAVTADDLEATLDAIVALSEDAIFTAESTGQVTSWSRTASRLFGRSATDVVGRSLASLFPVGRSAEVAVLAIRAAAGDTVLRHQTEVLRTDGVVMPVSLSVAPVPAADGRVRQLTVVARDLTEQYVGQATLAEMEARLQEGEALAHLGSWLWDVRTGTVQWSLEFHRIHGIDPLEFEGTIEAHLSVISPEDLADVRAGMQRSVTSGATFEAEYSIVRPGGAVRRLHARAHPMPDSTGQAIGLRGVGQDVTDQTPPA